MGKVRRGKGLEQLTQRELEILGLIADGLANQAIAERLGISLGTVKWYLKQIYSKLQVESRTQAVAISHTLGLLDAKPVLFTASTARHNFPYLATPFIGRTEELATIARDLENPACRLLTLVGLGGIGKTRLALQAAEQQISNFAHGVYFVSLAPISSPQSLVSTIAGALQLSFYGPVSPEVQLLNFLREKHMLLLFDNFEHLLEGAPLISNILVDTLKLKILVTSRERLNLQEEWVLSPEGLPYPDDQATDSIEGYPAVQLFSQRARRVQANFSLDVNATSVVTICQQVEGMPLALELAATWLRVMPCEQIAERIATGLDLLEASLRSMPERHRSLRAAFEQSWRLLAQSERAVLAVLSVFRGSFDLQAAVNVAETSLPVLASLVDKSLIRVNETGRFDMHELLRQYAEEQLEAAGEGEATRQSHCQYYADFLQHREADLKGRRLRAAVDEIDANFDNVQVACTWMIAHRDYDRINQVVETLYRYGIDFNHLPEIQVFWRQALAQFTPPPGENMHPAWGRLLVRSVYNLSPEPSPRIRDSVEQALDMARRRGDIVEIGFSLWALGVLSLTSNDAAQALAQFEESLACYQQLTDRFYRAYYLAEVYAWIGWYCKQLGQLDDSARYFHQGRELCREIGDKFHEALHLHRLAIIAIEMGHIGEAEQLIRQSDSTFPIVPRESNRAMVYTSWSGLIALLRGDYEQIRSNGEALLNGLTDLEYWGTNRDALGFVGVAACLDEDYLEGKRLCEEATRLSHLALVLFAPAGEWGLALANCGLGDYDAARRHVEALQRLGAARRSVLALVVSLPPQAVILAHAGKSERAVELLGLAFSYLSSMSGWMARWPLLTRLRANLEAELGPEVYAAAWEQGKALDLDTVVAEFLK